MTLTTICTVLFTFCQPRPNPGRPQNILGQRSWGNAFLQVTGLFVLRPGHVHRAIHSLCTHAVGNFHSRREVMHRKPTRHIFRR